MRKRLSFLLHYSLLWIIILMIMRGVFLLYHFDKTAELSFPLIGGTIYKGLHMDLAIYAYFLLFPSILLAISTLINRQWIFTIIKYYTYMIVPLSLFIYIGDMELFGAWDFRLDATPLKYINNPTEMLASTAEAPYFLLLSIWGILTASSLWCFSAIFKRASPFLPAHPTFSLVYILYAAFLIIPARGGLQLSPLNVSDAYFSNNSYANQAAINPIWSFFDGINHSGNLTEHPYLYLPDSLVKENISDLFSSKNKQDSLIPLFNSPNPNVIIILWESLTANVVGACGADFGATPRFDELCHEGIFFNSMYACCFRSDKGVLAAISGFPSVPKKSVMVLTQKAKKLSSISKVLKQDDYHTAFYYGGESNFTNMRAYMINQEIDTIIEKSNFPSSSYNSKWGVHDHIFLKRILENHQHPKEPFFTLAFTLSSHEPFEVPTTDNYPNDGYIGKFYNAIHYTDSAVGDFIDQARQQAWWDNTVIIITADHGHKRVGDLEREDPKKYHIPMLWLGGALNVKDTTITTICSQLDISRTLLESMGYDSLDLKWSRNIFKADATDFAPYIYNAGIGIVSKNDTIIWDHNSQSVLEKYSSKDVSDSLINTTKSYLQEAYSDFLAL